MRDVLLVRRHGPARQLRDALEQSIQPDRTRVGDELEEVDHQQLSEAERDLRIANPCLDCEVGYVLSGGSENCGHSRFVEMASVAKQMRSGLDRKVAPPLERPDGVAAVLVHDP